MTQGEAALRPMAAPGPRTIFSITLPLIAGFLLEQLIGMTDVLFLGRYGEAELAAAGAAGIFVLLAVMLGVGYAIGAQSLMSRFNGAREHAELGAVFRQSAIFLIASGCLIALAVCSFGGALFAGFMEDPKVSSAAESYIFWRTAGLPFAYLTILGRSFFVAIMKPRIVTLMSVVMVSVNCGLNAVLIFGLGSFPELGIAGAAIASALSELAAVMVLLAGLARERRWWRICFGTRADWRIDSARQKTLFDLGRWLILQEAMAFGVWLYFFIAVENAGGERALALSNIVRQLGAMLFLFVHAFGAAAGTIAANLAGAGRSGEIEPAMKLTFWLCLGSMLPIFLLYAVFPNAVLGLLTDIPEVVADARPSYYVMTVSYLLTMPAYLGYFVIGVLGYARESFRITTAAVAVYAAYIWLLDRFEPATAVYWTSDTVYGVMLGAGVWLAWRKARRMNFRAEEAPAPGMRH